MESLPASSIRNILIVRLSAIGDVVHVLPCLHALRQQFPQAHIGWLVEELSATLLRGHPEINSLFVIPKKRWRGHPLRVALNGEKRDFYRNLRKTPWDVAIDFQGLTKSGWPTWRSGARLRIGYGGKDSREMNRLFINRPVRPPDTARHVIERNLSLLAPIGIPDDRIAWRFPDWSAERAELGDFLAAHGSGYLAIYPGAGWATKRWPAENFAALCRRIAEHEKTARLPMVLVWGPGEEDLCDRIMKQAALAEAQLHPAPRTNLRQLAVIMEQATAVIGGDTGPIHLAAALGRPVAGIYGASDPVRNGPWGERTRVIQADPRFCTTCWKTECGHTSPLECLRQIQPEDVLSALLDLLNP